MHQQICRPIKLKIWRRKMEEDKQEDEEYETDDMNVEDLANHADDKIDALLQLLIKKGIITEEEYDKEFDDLYDEEIEEEKE